MIKVAINGYGTIGKRVADAVSAQKDMEIIGVSKKQPSTEALIAVKKGFPAHITDISKKGAFKKAGIPVAGSVDEVVQKADIIIDATPGRVGVSNKALYEKYKKIAIWQGGEECELAGFSFNAHTKYKEAIGTQYVRVVSCNTTGLCRVIKAIDDKIGVMKVKAVMGRSGEDPHVVNKGPIDAVVLDPMSTPIHHGPGVNTVLPHINIVMVTMIVPTTQMHMHAILASTWGTTNYEFLIKNQRDEESNIKNIILCS